MRAHCSASSFESPQSSRACILMCSPHLASFWRTSVLSNLKDVNVTIRLRTLLFFAVRETALERAVLSPIRYCPEPFWQRFINSLRLPHCSFGPRRPYTLRKSQSGCSLDQTTAPRWLPVQRSAQQIKSRSSWSVLDRQPPGEICKMRGVVKRAEGFVSDHLNLLDR